MKEDNMKNEWLTVGEMRLHIPSFAVGGLRLAVSAFGTGQPYRDEVMQAWFDGFGALLSTECGLSQHEATEYLHSMLVTLLPHTSKNVQESIMKSIAEHRGRGQETCPGNRKAECHSTVDVAIHLFGLPDYELDDYELTGHGIRKYATASREWLGTVADAVDKLLGDGWSLQVVKSNVEARHPEVRTCQEAVERLGRLQIEEAIMLDIDIAEFSAEGERLSPV